MFASKGALATPSEFATIDSFGDDYNKWYEANEASEVAAFKVSHNPYIVGKFGAINEAIMAVTARAFEGKPIRTSEGKAVNINQSYWIAKSKEEFIDAQQVSKKFAWKKAFGEEKDLIGRVYEYFLKEFAVNATKEEGEFYTPHDVVQLIATFIEPFDGTLYDPCCGSGGMFIQSAELVNSKLKRSSCCPEARRAI